jgi:biopolymer transport protein ExbD
MKINLLETESDEARIEIIPLIDVVFCILTFFILASLTLTRQQAINLDLPKASSGVAQNRDLKIVSIAPNGELFIDKLPTDTNQLVADLKAYIKSQPNGLIVLNASPTVSYNQVIQVLDLLRSVGGQRVALATQPTNQPVLADPNSPAPGTFPILPNGTPLPGTVPGGSGPGGTVPGGVPTPDPNLIPPVDPNAPPPPPPSSLESPP